MWKKGKIILRLGDFIDVYVTQKDGNLKHYWANNFTGLVYQNEIIWSSVYGKPAVIRFENNVDIYVLTKSRSLVHLWNGDYTNWKYNNEVLVEGISEPPVAVRWENDGVLLHLHASPSTNWQYESKEIYRSYNHTCLFALRAKREAIDLYFLESGHIIHSYVGDHNGWVYANERILEGTNIPNGNFSATRTDNCINLFYCAETGHVCHAICGDFTGWSYQNRGSISMSITARYKEFSVVQHENNIDVYFIGNDNCVHHNYNGVYNNFTWNSDEIISLSDAISGIAAVRPYQKAIDVYYLGQDEQLNHLFIGEETNNGWSRYQTVLSNPTLYWENLRNFATIIGEGYHGKIYLIRKDSDKFIVKKFKIPNPLAIRSEMIILNKLASIWPNLCQAQIFENGNLAGFAMLYIEGKKLDKILQDKENIFHKSTAARIKLIKIIGEYMNRMQKLGICHDDFSLDNIMVNQKNKNSKNDVTVMILDFGNSFFFNSNTRTQAILTGWQCLKPSESKFAFETIYDFLRKNPQAEWQAVEGKNYILLYASAGISIEDDIFITINAEAKVVLFKIISDSGSNITTVDFEIWKAQIGVQIGSYNGFELYVALVKGKVSVFGIKIGAGISSGVGINQDSYETKVFGTEYFVGRRIGISVFDSEFGVDFKQFFSDEQWNA
ncbi:unnamed protein product [Rotaria sordida]|uniref:Protein kinase domain-containing protein n=1 Tax=Rotaria sordida TaxID=392033 RepID=A0A816AV40_9BILA|nr:unnamed protein product [Rotaria sordida]CAF1602387.1 unnamed protein product [Rotaria sordida]